MPGAFHTEVLVARSNQLRVYLLDIHWKNPTVLDSSVEVSLSDDLKTEAGCTREKESFLCTFPDKINLQEPGEILVRATRLKQKGAVAKYKTPLKYGSK